METWLEIFTRRLNDGSAWTYGFTDDEIKTLIGSQQHRDSKWMKTVNGDIIRPNLLVWTYDWRWGKVKKEDFIDRLMRNQRLVDRGLELSSNDFWFDVEYPDGYVNMYNNERMTTQCPRCWGDWEGCHNGGCGGREKARWTGWPDA